MSLALEPRSHIYCGNIHHRRFQPKAHVFHYRLYMLALDVDEVEQKRLPSGLFGYRWYNPIRFVQNDYIPGEPARLKVRIINKVLALGGNKAIEKVTMLVQARCFGLYFSPANFYFCYDQNDQCQYMLVEVSNTPWNQRHYYLVDMNKKLATDKAFHVSPFMDLDMKYHWCVSEPSQHSPRLSVHIENKRAAGDKLFDATLAMNKIVMTNDALFQILKSFPLMTFKIVGGIYLQALKLFMKRIKFVSYQTKENK